MLVQEYADFQCPSCNHFHDAVGSTVADLVASGKLRFAYTYFQSLTEESVTAAVARVCAGDKGRFFELADLLTTNQQVENPGFFTTDRVVGFGQEAGIVGKVFDRLEQCVRDNRYEGFVRMTPDQLASPDAFDQAVADAART